MIRVFVSNLDVVDLKTMNFQEESPRNREKLIEYLQNIQYTETDIITAIINDYEDL